MSTWMKQAADSYAGGPSRIEHAACLCALRAVKIAPSTVARAAGLAWPGDKLTFSVLAAYADFPARPAVSEEPLDELSVLIGRFSRSRLAHAWVEAWDLRPTTPIGGRVLVVSGASLGLTVVRDAAPPERPHVLIGHASGLRLVVEPLAAWCRRLSWGEPVWDRDED